MTVQSMWSTFSNRTDLKNKNVVAAFNQYYSVFMQDHFQQEGALELINLFQKVIMKYEALKLKGQEDALRDYTNAMASKTADKAAAVGVLYVFVTRFIC
jgi:hypothetical protein